MRVLSSGLLLSAVAVAACTATSPPTTAAEFVVPSLVYRTGPYAPNGIPFADGFMDYFTLLNERDGGIEGVPLRVVECETAYNTDQGMECYENLKGAGPGGALLIQPLSTGITYQLIPRAAVDEIPIFSMGYGRTSAADGRVFPWVFNFPTTYWSQATAFIRYIGEQEGGLDNLAGKKIALVYHNSAYGKEPIRTLQFLAERYGYQFQEYAVDHPGQEQKSTWLQIRRERPDWVLMWGWGVMNQVAVQEAASIGYPMDRFIGVWWAGAEVDVLPAGEAAHGYLSGNFHFPGGDFPVHDAIRAHVYARGLGSTTEDRVGEVLYNRGMLAAMFQAEAIRNAILIHGTTEISGRHVRDGLEAIDLDEARLAELGMPDFTHPVTITCADHEGNGPVIIQQWDAHARVWNVVSDWIEPMRDVVRPMIEDDAAAYAAENDITPRDCG